MSVPCLKSPWIYTLEFFFLLKLHLYKRGQKLVFEELEEQGGNYEGDKNHTDPPSHTYMVSEWSDVYLWVTSTV